MRLERLPEYVTVTLVTALGIAFAVFAGRYAGSGQVTLILMLLAAIAVVTVAVTLRKALWILIPIGWAFEGQIPDLPLPFSVRDIIVGIVFSVYCVFIALKIVRVRPQLRFLDLLVFANLTYLGITFLRHPVGIEALGSERVGGRPYFTIFIAVLGYWVLRRATPTVRELLALPWLITGANLFIGGLNILAYVVPWTAPILSRFYSGISTEAYANESMLGGGENDKGRLNQLSGFGVTAMGLLCSFYRPITLFFPWVPGRFFLFMSALIAIVFSGHRSALLTAIMIFTLASYYRDRLRDALQLGVLGAVGIFVLTIAQGRIIELPFAVQRTLSWLPGEWNYQAVSDAQGSTQWRVEMWKLALKDSTYINNKLLGDGFGFTKWDLAVIHASEIARRTGVGTVLDYQESSMRVGNYHSGPISTLKFVGVIGSILYYALFFSIAAYAHRLILRAKGTPLFPTALFLCIPNVYFPFAYIVIFGGFDTAFAVTVVSLGTLQAFERGLEQMTGTLLPTNSSAARTVLSSSCRSRQLGYGSGNKPSATLH